MVQYIFDCLNCNKNTSGGCMVKTNITFHTIFYPDQNKKRYLEKLCIFISHMYDHEAHPFFSERTICLT